MVSQLNDLSFEDVLIIKLGKYLGYEDALLINLIKKIVSKFN